MNCAAFRHARSAVVVLGGSARHGRVPAEGHSRHRLSVARDHRYLLDNQQIEAARRLAAFSALFDQPTFRHLREIGLGPRVARMGSWRRPRSPGLARPPGRPHGEVLSTDLDPTWLTASGGRPNLRVRRHDVVLDPPRDGTFDLVLVLVHIRQRDRALAAMVSALRPGGYLVVEEADPSLQPLTCLEDAGPAEHLANRLKTAFRQVTAERGVDPDLRPHAATPTAPGRTVRGPRRRKLPHRRGGLPRAGARHHRPDPRPAWRPSKRSSKRSNSTWRTSPQASSTPPPHR
jgi:hypothetical protein